MACLSALWPHRLDCQRLRRDGKEQVDGIHGIRGRSDLRARALLSKEPCKTHPSGLLDYRIQTTDGWLL